MNLAEKFAKQNGIEWHEVKVKGQMLYGGVKREWVCSCGAIFSYEETFERHLKARNPTFSHPEEVLAVCMKWDDYRPFILSINGNIHDQDGFKIDWMIPLSYITTPGKLLEAAVEWREGREK
jgi:hypothetical protein